VITFSWKFLSKLLNLFMVVIISFIEPLIFIQHRQSIDISEMHLREPLLEGSV